MLVNAVVIAFASPRISKSSVNKLIVAFVPESPVAVPAFKLKSLALAAQLVVPSVLPVST